MFRDVDTLHYLNKRDYLIRQGIFNSELKSYLLKTIIFDKRIVFKNRFVLKNKSLFFNKFRISIMHGRCRLTGKSRFVFKYFKLNRSSLKLYSSFGFVSGFQKW